MKSGTMITIGAVTVVALIVIEQMQASSNAAKVTQALAAKAASSSAANVTGAQNPVAQNISAAGGVIGTVLNSAGFQQTLNDLTGTLN